MARRSMRVIGCTTFIGVAGILAGLLVAAGAGANSASTYIVLYKGSSVPADAAKTIQSAGGWSVYSYDQIGVVIARSSSESFPVALSKDSKIEGVSATAGFATRVADELVADPGQAAPSVPVSDSDNLSGLQWDMAQIHTPEAHAITGGSPSVVVGDIDTGLDFTHPDLAPNVDFADSASCVGGAPDQNPAAWDDDNGHGTHTAGTIAAAANGIGIVGVAPNVRIAGIKAGNADGFFFPEAVVCAFMWAGSHHLDVTNNSYFADPWLFNCKNDAEQHAIWKAEQRAIRYAMQQGVTVVAAEGNENIDLSKQNIDTISPDTNPNPSPREVKNSCVVIPVEIPGVIGVTGNGNLGQKAYYSSYGVGVAQVVAPGGDRRFQVTAAAPNGRVLSTWPAKFFSPSPLIIKDPTDPAAVYAYLQGTSMASPHVAGVAALAISADGKMSPGAVQALIDRTADSVDCPPNPFNPGPPFDFLAICEGGPGYNGFYGHGQVNALKAVS
jgi:lantibiotic leader peptide-processing serine protease